MAYALTSEAEQERLLPAVVRRCSGEVGKNLIWSDANVSLGASSAFNIKSRGICLHFIERESPLLDPRVLAGVKKNLKLCSSQVHTQLNSKLSWALLYEGYRKKLVASLKCHIRSLYP